MQREVTDGGGTKWVCVQAYAGLAGGGGGGAAAEAADEDGRVEVVCTPGGGAQTVRLKLAAGWDDRCSDEELLREIEAGGSGGAGS